MKEEFIWKRYEFYKFLAQTSKMVRKGYAQRSHVGSEVGHVHLSLHETHVSDKAATSEPEFRSDDTPQVRPAYEGYAQRTESPRGTPNVPRTTPNVVSSFCPL